MNLLRFYLMIGSNKLQAEAYNKEAHKNGIINSKFSYIKKAAETPKKGILPTSNKKIDSGFPGTDGDGFFLWQTEPIDYATDKEKFYKQNHPPLKSEYAQLWLKEETAIFNFLEHIQPRLPCITEFCNGDFFSLLKCIYADMGHGASVALPCFSSKLISKLNEINAGFDCDVELEDVHFSRVSSKYQKK
ncbi:MAG: hypothetical protein J0H59_07590 [Comamonadaceae bacterium]|nr:hypothetical protein [Comamonadaceae bacterium]